MTTRIARDLRRATGLHCAACHVPVHSSGLAVRYQDALCGVTPDSVHTLDPRRVEIGPTTGRLRIDRPGDRWLFFATDEARDAYLAMYGHRYDYTLTWSDVSGFALEAVITRVIGGEGEAVPVLESVLDSRGRQFGDVEDGLYDGCDINCRAGSHDASCEQA